MLSSQDQGIVDAIFIYRVKTHINKINILFEKVESNKSIQAQAQTYTF